MADLLSRIFWPALFLGLAMAVTWRFVPLGRLRTNLQIIGSLLVFVPQLIIIFFLYQSISLLLYQEALLSLWMLGAAVLLGAQSFSPRLRARQRQRNPAVLAFAALLLGGFGLYLGWTFAGDAFRPRKIVEGRVEGLKFNRGSRAPRLSDIFINGQRFHATRDLHSRLQPGDYIRAEIGAGSGAILRWERQPTR